MDKMLMKKSEDGVGGEVTDECCTRKARLKRVRQEFSLS
jgi:hypothetical protein